MPDTKYSNKISAYTTPLVVELTYGYRNTVQRKILIKKETGGLGSGGNSDTSGGSSGGATSGNQEIQFPGI